MSMNSIRMLYFAVNHSVQIPVNQKVDFYFAKIYPSGSTAQLFKNDTLHLILCDT